MAQYSKYIRGNFTSTGVNKFLSLPFLPDMIEIWNKTKWATTTNHISVAAWSVAEENVGTAYTTTSNGTAWAGQVLTSGGFTFISAGSPTYGAIKTMSGAFATAANPVNITVTAHGYQTGDTVVVYGTTGMLQIAGIPYVITRVDANNFTIPVNGSGFASASTAGFVKQLFYPDLYVPYTCYITNISQATQAVVTTSTNHNFVVGQEVFFTVPVAWGMSQIDNRTYLKTNNVILQAYVIAIGSTTTPTNTFTINLNTTTFTAFAYPTSAVAALGGTVPNVAGMGDANTGYTLTNTGDVPYLGTTTYPPRGLLNTIVGLPGAFGAQTRQGVIVGTGDGTTVIHATGDIIEFRATFPDSLLLNQ